MKLLLDTCAFLWVVNGSPDLSSKAKELFTNPMNEVFLSAVSCWEIAVKYGLGRLPLPRPPHEYIPNQREKHGIFSLELDEESSLHLARLPELHKDSFDRMLVCQALVHGLMILTPDKLISQYPAKTAW